MDYLGGMSDPDEKREGSKPLSPLQAKLADVAERRRKDPNWAPRFDGYYSGPDPDSLAKMTEADYAAWLARREEAHRRLHGDWHPVLLNPLTRPVEPHVVRQEEPSPPPPRPQPVVRASLSFGERLRNLRRVLGWTQREAAWQLGISARTVIRYEQGTHHPQLLTLLTLQALESDHAQELDVCNDNHQPARA
jgi:DNA-binding XRE family transcriptional regulator